MKGIYIGKHYIEVPIIQGGMGVGVSLDQLAGTVSSYGALGTISSICTGYYKDMQFIDKAVDGRPLGTENTFSAKALNEIFKNARKICGDKPLACNILHAINDYQRVVKDAVNAGANIIVTGAGLPLDLPSLVADFPDVAIIPIVSSDRALRIIAKKWMQSAGRLPDAVIVEGPRSGGHQGAKKEELFLPEHQLEAILPQVVAERDKLGDFPVIAAGGIFDKDDIEKMMALGADAVQLGTRFIATPECDASDEFKQMLINSKEEDMVIVSSPVGYPGRAMRSHLTENLKPGETPIKCISNCIFPCKRGEGARKVGYCIADSLGDSYLGRVKTGLFFSGANGYRVNKMMSVKELIDELLNGPK